MSGKRIGDGPIAEEYRQMMNDVAVALDRFFNGSTTGQDRTTGYVLLAWPFGDDQHGRCNYISNAEPADILPMLRYQVARLEGQAEVSGTA